MGAVSKPLTFHDVCPGNGTHVILQIWDEDPGIFAQAESEVSSFPGPNLETNPKC